MTVYVGLAAANATAAAPTSFPAIFWLAMIEITFAGQKSQREEPKKVLLPMEVDMPLRRQVSSGAIPDNAGHRDPILPNSASNFDLVILRLLLP